MKIIIVAVSGLLALALAACNSSTDLSRSKAKSIINADFQAGAVTTLAMSPQDIEDGAALDLWKPDGTKTMYGGAIYALTPKGAKVFKSWLGGGPRFPGSDPRLVTFCKMVMEVNEITGISDIPLQAATFKNVEFNTRARPAKDCQSYDLQEFLEKSQTRPSHKYTMKRYDDGWRIQQ